MLLVLLLFMVWWLDLIVVRLGSLLDGVGITFRLGFILIVLLSFV